MFIITCRPSLALLRGPFIIVFQAEFSSIEGTINNQQLTLVNRKDQTGPPSQNAEGCAVALYRRLASTPRPSADKDVDLRGLEFRAVQNR